MEAEVDEAVRITKVQLHPVHGSIQVDLDAMSQHLHFRVVGRNHHLVLFVHLMSEELRESVDQDLAYRHRLFALKPLLELSACFFNGTFRAYGFICQSFVQLDECMMGVAENSDRIALEVGDVLHLEVLINLPEGSVVVL